MLTENAVGRLFVPDQLALNPMPSTVCPGLTVAFQDAKGKRGFTGPVTMVTFGSEQYVWKPDGAKSYADPDGPPATRVLQGNQFTLPKASVTVLRGRIDGGGK